MKAEPYDVSRVAAQLIHFVMRSGFDIDDSILVLQTAERLLRQAQADSATPGKSPCPARRSMH